MSHLLPSYFLKIYSDRNKFFNRLSTRYFDKFELLYFFHFTKIFNAVKNYLCDVEVSPEVKLNKVLKQFNIIKDRTLLNHVDERLVKTPLRYFTEFLRQIFPYHKQQHIHWQNNLFRLSIFLWQNAEETAKKYLYSFQFPEEQLSEMQAVQEVLEKPENCNLHLANSMAVPYVNFMGIKPEQNIEVFANRGTSGIDGSTSTAVVVALANPVKENILITRYYHGLLFMCFLSLKF